MGVAVTPTTPQRSPWRSTAAQHQYQLTPNSHHYHHHHHHHHRSLPRSVSTDSISSHRTVHSKSHDGATLRAPLSDRRLVTLANEAAAIVQWERILRAPEPRQTRWKHVETVGAFFLYTRLDGHRFEVLAIGSVDASVPELASLLQSRDDDDGDHVQRLEALYGEQLKHAAHVHDVDLRDDSLPELPLGEGLSTLASLSVKTATFQKPSVVSSHEQWCYVDAVYKHASSQIFEKHMASLRAKDVLAGKCPSKTKDFRDVVVGYYVQPENPHEALYTEGAPAGKNGASKVCFYAELYTPKQLGFSMPAALGAVSERSIRRRLVRLAQSCARLPQLVYRRRLGVQVTVDGSRIFPPTNVPCVACDRHLLVAKLCRLCGHGVCGDCSMKYERERQVRDAARIRIESVRVCSCCIRRVNAADYAHLGDMAFAPTVVVPDPEDARPPASVLSTLLQEALLNAPSAQKKASVMNVIKCVLDQEMEPSTPSRGGDFDPAKWSADEIRRRRAASGRRLTITPTATAEDYSRALQSLDVPKVPHSEATVAGTSGRAYTVDPTNAVDKQMAHPVPENDAARVQAIQETHIREIGRSEELNLICTMASKELECFATLVTIVDRDDLYVAASTLPMLEQTTFARNDSFCAHTVMSSDPLIVPHPEADVRFHQNSAIGGFGVKYYCGFPVMAGDAVIGAVCCVDSKSRELTESQYTYLKKLADTASKVVSLHKNERLRSLSAVSEARSEGAGSDVP